MSIPSPIIPLKQPIVAEAIQENEYKDVIEKLLFELIDPRLLDQDKTYENLFALIPNMDERSIGTLLKRLPNFLDLTAHLADQQCRLALLLGEVHYKHKRYLVSMGFFAQSIQIGKQQKNKELQKEAHQGASKLLFSFIRDEFLSIELIKNKLERARSLNKADDFGKLIEQIKSLKRLCCNEDCIKFITDLFKQAEEVLNKKGAPQNFIPFVGMITQEWKTPKQPSEICITEKYQNALNEFRASFAWTAQIKECRSFQGYIMNKFRDLFEIFLKDGFAVLGEPPCDYDIRAIGSIGREEPSLFSDLEFMILFENAEHQEYFTRLIKFLEVQVMSLGETPGKEISFTCLGSKNISAFHLDMGGNPLLNADLMGTPEKMAALQREVVEAALGREHLPGVAANQVLKSKTLLKNQDIKLFIDYQKAMNEILDRGEIKSLRQKRALQLLTLRGADYQKVWPLAFNLITSPINVKNQYLHFLNFFLADLALYFGIEHTNTLDIIISMVEKNIFNENTGNLLQEAVVFIYYLRLRIHQYYENQNEEGFVGGLSGYQFTKQEIEQLEKIYWLILRPLFYSCLPLVLKEGRPLEKIFYNLDIISICFEEVYSSQNNSNFFIPLIRHAATHFVKIKVPHPIHLEYFQKLSKRNDLEPLRESYLDILEKEHLPANELEQIRTIPNRAGLRLSFLRNENKLREQIESISSPNFHSEKNTSNVRLMTSGKIRYLKPEVVREILDDSGDLRMGYPGSGHKVTTTAGLHFKETPTHPLMEYAIHNLFHRLCGELTPPTELVRFEVDGEKMYPVLISSTVTGLTLKKRLEKPLTLENPQQWKRWTWLLLCSFLSRPGDGRPSNYVMDSKDNIFCIDNDISFVEPLVQGVLTSQVNFHCALFCLFQDKPLDPNALEDFCSLDADLILLGWIEDVIKKEAEYLSLFTEEERISLYENDPKNRFKATILFKEGVLATLNMQFTYLQNQLTSLIKHKKTLTPLDLLKHTIVLNDSPSLSVAPGIYLSIAYLKANHPTIEDKLKWITSRTHTQSLNSIQSDEACLGKVPTMEEVERRKLFSPVNAKKELFVSTLHLHSPFISVGTMHGNEILRATFKEIRENNMPDLERQKKVLRSLTYLMQLKDKIPISISLQHCAALNTNTIGSFLHQDLEYLDLSYCPEIKNGDIVLIQNKCPNLKELHLSGCFGLTGIVGGVLFSQPLSFYNLKVLSINACKNLKYVYLQSPSLNIIMGNNNPELIQVKLKSFLPLNMKFEDCPKLEPIKINVAFMKMVEWGAIGISKELQIDEKFMLAAVKQDGISLQFGSEEIRKNSRIVLKSVKQNGLALAYASDELKNDWEIVTAAVNQNFEALKYANEILRKDIEHEIRKQKQEAFLAAKEKLKERERILAQVKTSGNDLQLASEELRDDKEIVLAAVKNSGHVHSRTNTALQYASRRLRNNREIVLAALQNDCGSALLWASDELKDDPEIVLFAVQKCGDAYSCNSTLSFASQRLRNDRKIVLTALQHDAYSLIYASEELKDDREIVLTAVQTNGGALQYANKKFLDDRDIVLAAVKSNGYAISGTSKRLQSDKEIALAAVQENGGALFVLSDEFKDNKEIVRAAICQNWKSFQFASERLKKEKEIIELVNKLR